jgi:hypothetical protein
MTMRERIARAMNSTAHAPHEKSWAEDEWPQFLPAADAVLAELRTPTSAMMEAGYAAVRASGHKGGMVDHARYQAQIDAAGAE